MVFVHVCRTDENEAPSQAESGVERPVVLITGLIKSQALRLAKVKTIDLVVDLYIMSYDVYCVSLYVYKKAHVQKIVQMI